MDNKSTHLCGCWYFLFTALLFNLAFLFNLTFPINLHVVSRLQSDARFAFLESTNWLSSMRSDQFAVSLFCNHTISAQFVSLSPPTNNCVPPDWFGLALKYKSALCSSDSIRNVGASMWEHLVFWTVTPKLPRGELHRRPLCQKKASTSSALFAASLRQTFPPH